MLSPGESSAVFQDEDISAAEGVVQPEAMILR